MKKLIAVLFLTSMVSPASAAEYAPQEFDFSELGTVESVRQVPMLEPLHNVSLPNVFEHPLRPETVNELVIRVDDGRELVVRDEAMHRFVTGERVRLEASSGGPRIEHE